MVDESSDQDANSDTDFSESDCSESESEAEPTPAKRKRPTARKPPTKRVSDQAPAESVAAAEVAESGVLCYDGGGRTGALARDLVDLLNSVTLKQLKALHTIGAKRAELIAQRRAVQPFATVLT
jgi:DNA uptake protein ComE-like DNA-binding protein